jgi:hypothetical protein
VTNASGLKLLLPSAVVEVDVIGLTIGVPKLLVRDRLFMFDAIAMNND